MNSGDEVTHQGHLWTVVYVTGGLVKIHRGDELKVVRLNQVKKISGSTCEECQGNSDCGDCVHQGEGE